MVVLLEQEHGSLEAQASERRLHQLWHPLSPLDVGLAHGVDPEVRERRIPAHGNLHAQVRVRVEELLVLPDAQVLLEFEGPEAGRPRQEDHRADVDACAAVQEQLLLRDPDLPPEGAEQSLILQHWESEDVERFPQRVVPAPHSPQHALQARVEGVREVVVQDQHELRLHQPREQRLPAREAEVVGHRDDSHVRNGLVGSCHWLRTMIGFRALASHRDLQARVCLAEGDPQSVQQVAALRAVRDDRDVVLDIVQQRRHLHIQRRLLGGRTGWRGRNSQLAKVLIQLVVAEAVVQICHGRPGVRILRKTCGRRVGQQRQRGIELARNATSIKPKHLGRSRSNDLLRAGAQQACLAGSKGCALLRQGCALCDLCWPLLPAAKEPRPRGPGSQRHPPERRCCRDAAVVVSADQPEVTEGAETTDDTRQHGLLLRPRNRALVAELRLGVVAGAQPPLRRVSGLPAEGLAAVGPRGDAQTEVEQREIHHASWHDVAGGRRPVTQRHPQLRAAHQRPVRGLAAGPRREELGVRRGRVVAAAEGSPPVGEVRLHEKPIRQNHHFVVEHEATVDGDGGQLRPVPNVHAVEGRRDAVDIDGRPLWASLNDTLQPRIQQGLANAVTRRDAARALNLHAHHGAAIGSVRVRPRQPRLLEVLGLQRTILRRLLG
mmetsp:Transcript_3641/g.13356  ORF Transcript_3641/g.13356 Transcript_3641/m.13356 type:complete len:662 (-) Transcript_3641:474-2459(-)